MACATFGGCSVDLDHVRRPSHPATPRNAETKSSRSTAARLRLFDCRTSPARTTGIAVEKTRRMHITVQRLRTWLPRAAPHMVGPIHFSAQLFQHINGFSTPSPFLTYTDAHV